MSRYDGLIIPRSYSEYINKTDAATLQQALQLSGVMDAAPTANSNNPVKSNGIYNTNSFIESSAFSFANNSANEKIILLGVMETNADNRAGANLDISYRRADTIGRMFATLRADEVACKYLCITPSYIPVNIIKTRITAYRKYNIYLRILGYTPITKVVINTPLNFIVQGVEKSVIEGTKITCTPVNINDL